MTLKGEVNHESESNAAFDAVRPLRGIGGITDKIVVSLPASTVDQLIQFRVSGRLEPRGARGEIDAPRYEITQNA